MGIRLMAAYDPLQLVSELTAAGLAVDGADATGRVQYARDLTPEEQATAAAVLAAHDPMKRERDELTARQQAKAYRDGLQAYLDLASPTGAQTVAAVKAIIRVLFWVVRNDLK